MKARKLAPIAMILALVLGALPVAAEHRSHDGGDARLVRLSHDLATTTEELRREVAGSHHGWRFHRRYTLRILYSLERDATTFHHRVERWGAHDRATRRAYRRLETSFAAASERFPAKRIRHDIRHDFFRVAALMEKVDTRMARLDRRSAYRRHARRDRFGEHGDRWSIAWNFGY